MTPQAQTVLTHLTQHGPLTRVQAEAVYRIRHLPGTINMLRDLGFEITSKTHKDATGQRYVSYSI